MFQTRCILITFMVARPLLYAIQFVLTQYFNESFLVPNEIDIAFPLGIKIMNFILTVLAFWCVFNFTRCLAKGIIADFAPVSKLMVIIVSIAFMLFLTDAVNLVFYMLSQAEEQIGGDSTQVSFKSNELRLKTLIDTSAVGVTVLMSSIFMHKHFSIMSNVSAKDN
jgi:hypothetical protein